MMERKGNFPAYMREISRDRCRAHETKELKNTCKSQNILLYHMLLMEMQMYLLVYIDAEIDFNHLVDKQF